MTTLFFVTVVCDGCNTRKSEGFLGSKADAHDNLIERLVKKGWEKSNVAWEEDKILCPDCQIKGE